MRESRFLSRVRAEQTRSDLLGLLQGRFGIAVATELASAINAIENPELLNELYELAAVRFVPLEEFRAALRAQPTQR
jgi:hypothetical protein